MNKFSYAVNKLRNALNKLRNAVQCFSLNLMVDLEWHDDGVLPMLHISYILVPQDSWPLRESLTSQRNHKIVLPPATETPPG